ncbi:MAG: DUF3892 domain-containing protein [Oscillospiraceae bacterium]|nr:DUF3892 domain-containing protein [Oscillospiraceae bacterium]
MNNNFMANPIAGGDNPANNLAGMAAVSGAGKNAAALPLRAMREIPQARADAAKITALVKERGRVSGYQLSNGKILDKQSAINLARDGGIQGVGISSRKGAEYLKSLPDDSGMNNLNALPTVSAEN